jgi:endonuclease/exonuclease/phosphatase (EEP) superfamily protein YafD
MSGQPRDLRLFRPLLTLAVFALVLVSGLSLFGDVHWTFELLSNFRLILLGLNIALAVLAAVFGSRGAAALAAVMAIVQFSIAWPYVVTPPQAKSIGQGQTVRILWANLHSWDTNLAALEALVEAEKPDIAVFTELAVSHGQAFNRLRPILPFQSPLPRDGNPREMILLTVRPPVSLTFDYGPGPKTPLMVSQLCPAEGFCLTLLGLHAARPVPFGDTLRDLELDHAARVAHRFIELGDHVILVGDLNTTPFSPAFSRMLAIGGLVDAAIASSEKPHVPDATWGPSQSGPLPGFAIDHALLGPGLDLVELRTGAPIGSDHLPLVLDVRIAPKADR